MRLLLFFMLFLGTAFCGLSQNDLKTIRSFAGKLPEIQLDQQGNALALWVEDQTPYFATFRGVWEKAQNVFDALENHKDQDLCLEAVEKVSFAMNQRGQAVVFISLTQNDKNVLLPLFFTNNTWKKSLPIEIHSPNSFEGSLNNQGIATVVSADQITSLDVASEEITFQEKIVEDFSVKDPKPYALFCGSSLIYWKDPTSKIKGSLLKEEEQIFFDFWFADFKEKEELVFASLPKNRQKQLIALRTTEKPSLEVSFFKDLQVPLWEKVEEAPFSNRGKKITSPVVAELNKNQVFIAGIVIGEKKQKLIGTYYDFCKGWQAPFEICMGNKIESLQLLQGKKNETVLIWEVDKKPRLVNINPITAVQSLKANLGASAPPSITVAKQVLRRYPGYGDIVNILEFSVTDPSSVASFKIYRDSATNLIQETNDFFYEDHQRPKDRTTTYYVTCVGTDGTESSATVVSISPFDKPSMISITGDTGGTINVDPSKNINLRGETNEFSIIGDPASNKLTVDFLGAASAGLLSLTPDQGTSPVNGDGSGDITLAGGNSITSVGSANTVTFNLDSAVSVDTATASTSVTSPTYTTSGADTNITADTGQNIVFQSGDTGGTNKVSFVDSGAVEVTSLDSDGTLSAVVYSATGANNVLITAPGTQDITMQMGDTGGTNKVSFVDSGAVEVTSLDSDGTLSAVEYSAVGANNVLITAPGTQDITIQMGDAGGTNKVSITDSADAEVVSIGSTGICTFNNYINYETPRIATLKDEKSSGTNGGDFSSGAWRTRVLNTEYDPNGIVTLASNQFSLGAGTYYIYAEAPAFAVRQHRLKLRNITDSTDDILGDNAFAFNTNFFNTLSYLIGIITIGSAKTFEIQHRCETTKTINGLGVASTFGVNEVYTQVYIQKLSDT